MGGAWEWGGRSLWVRETCPCVDGEGKGVLQVNALKLPSSMFPPLDNECCVISVAVDYRVLPETIACTEGLCITQQCHTLT